MMELELPPFQIPPPDPYRTGTPRDVSTRSTVMLRPYRGEPGAWVQTLRSLALAVLVFLVYGFILTQCMDALPPVEGEPAHSTYSTYNARMLEGPP